MTTVDTTTGGMTDDSTTGDSMTAETTGDSMTGGVMIDESKYIKKNPSLL